MPLPARRPSGPWPGRRWSSPADASSAEARGDATPAARGAAATPAGNRLRPARPEPARLQPPFEVSVGFGPVLYATLLPHPFERDRETDGAAVFALLAVLIAFPRPLAVADFLLATFTGFFAALRARTGALAFARLRFRFAILAFSLFAFAVVTLRTAPIFADALLLPTRRRAPAEDVSPTLRFDAALTRDAVFGFLAFDLVVFFVDLLRAAIAKLHARTPSGAVLSSRASQPIVRTASGLSVAEWPNYPAERRFSLND